MKRRVALVELGGTIDSLGDSPLDLAWYTETGRRLPPGELLRQAAALCPDVELVPVPFSRRSSTELTSTDWLELLRLIDVSRKAGDVDSVVITHGTNTLEETAYFLQLTTNPALPVVLTGAMRPASAVGSDGLLNLVRAIRVAVDDQALGKGVLVAMNGWVFSARDVTKRNTFDVNAFEAPGSGPLGSVEADGRVLIRHEPSQPAGTVHFDVDHGLGALPRVDIVLTYVDADGSLVDAAVAAGAAGVVSAGAGAGRVSRGEYDALTRAVARGVVVCQSTRIAAGRVSRTPSLVNDSIVTADNLQPWKARILLSLALHHTNDPTEIQALFDRA